MEDVIARICRVRQKFKGQKEKDNCPTAVLFYIATGRQCPRSTNPWYDTIKELSGGANFHFNYFHQAVIFGMYPELEKACNDFDASIRQAFQKKEILSNRDLTKIENDTIAKCNLAESYFIAQPTEEQQQRINKNLGRAMDRYVNTEIEKCAPAVKLLAKALKKTLQGDEVIGHNFVNHFLYIDDCIKCGESLFSQERSIASEDVTKKVEQLFQLKNSGVLNDNFEIVNYSEFKNSPLVKALTYNGKEYNVSHNLMLPSNNTIKMNMEGSVR